MIEDNKNIERTTATIKVLGVLRSLLLSINEVSFLI